MSFDVRPAQTRPHHLSYMDRVFTLHNSYRASSRIRGAWRSWCSHRSSSACLPVAHTLFESVSDQRKRRHSVTNHSTYPVAEAETVVDRVVRTACGSARSCSPSIASSIVARASECGVFLGSWQRSHWRSTAMRSRLDFFTAT